jgi:putative tryptophan/tyrosine transport system ATP-binding protein
MLTMQNIQKSFNLNTPNESKLFNNFQLEIAQREFVIIVGSNGSGKSTLLNLIDGNLLVDKGNIFFNKQDIGHLSSYLRCKYISRVYQDPTMGTSPSLTIYENMSLALQKGNKYNLSKALSNSNKQEITRLLSLLELGLETKLDIKVDLLSGGQRQALSLLMAICSRPELLLLDEHTAALDPKAKNHIMRLTDKLVSEFEITTIMITHELKDALSYGDRCIMLHLGKKVLDIKGEEKQNMKPIQLMSLFHELTI